MTPFRSEELLAATSEAFRTGDVDALLGLFSSRPDATYAGSEAGESATGRAALRELFTGVLSRGERYGFAFGPASCAAAGEAVAVVADAVGTATPASGGQVEAEPETFAYRVSGVVVPEQDRWVWLLLHGAEPTEPVGV